MAHVGRIIREKQNKEAADAREMKALTRDFGVYGEINEIWTKQSQKAAYFKTFGWIAHTLLRWKKPDGSMVAWSNGRAGDILMAPTFTLKGGTK
jgi:hypothetical protein